MASHPRPVRAASNTPRRPSGEAGRKRLFTFFRRDRPCARHRHQPVPRTKGECHWPNRLRCGEGRRAFRPLSEAGFGREADFQLRLRPPSDRTATETAPLEGLGGRFRFHDRLSKAVPPRIVTIPRRQRNRSHKFSGIERDQRYLSPRYIDDEPMRRPRNPPIGKSKINPKPK